MKRFAWLPASLCLVYVCCLVTLAGGFADAAHAADGTWVQQTSGTTKDLNAVFFVNSTTGWAVGKAGTVVHTTDGGVTWSAQSVPVGITGYALTGVDFVDSQTGWISADGPTAGLDTILRTQDGGATWLAATIPLSSLTSSLADVDFVDAYHGVAGGFWNYRVGFPFYSLASSSDGGATWGSHGITPAFETNDIAWADTANVWACGGTVGGNAPALFHSSDAGVSWNQVMTDVNSALTILNGFAEVDFVNATHGWTVAPWIMDEDSGNGAVMLYTADGGATWSHRHWSEMGLANTDLPNTIDFVDLTHGWMATGSSTRSTTWRTTDGGLTWQSVAVTGIKPLADLDFVSDSCGWAVGSGGAIFHYATPAPTVTTFTPTSGPVGATVTITGSAFTGATRVAFHGTTAVFNAASATKITATVPASATTGTVAVTTPAGTGTSATSFTVTTPVVTPTVTLKLSGLTSGAVRLHKSVTAKGTVTPASLAGSKVKLKVQKKKGSKWVTVKTVTRTVRAYSSAGTYGWKYKPAKKGAYRMRATIAKTATHTSAKTPWRKFKVR